MAFVQHYWDKAMKTLYATFTVIILVLSVLAINSIGIDNMDMPNRIICGFGWILPLLALLVEYVKE